MSIKIKNGETLWVTFTHCDGSKKYITSDSLRLNYFLYDDVGKKIAKDSSPLVLNEKIQKIEDKLRKDHPLIMEDEEGEE